MDIISKRSGPRREDVQARALLEKNRGTIEKLADQISGGGYSAQKRARDMPKEPQAEGLILSDLKAPRVNDTPVPYVRVSPNHRVVVVDDVTSRQMHYLGEIRRIDGQWRFVLATKANGFFSPVEPEMAALLAALDGATMGGGRDDASLAAEIAKLLGYDKPSE